MTDHLRIVPCRSCGQYIVFLPTASGKSMPVDAESVTEGDKVIKNVEIIKQQALECQEAGCPITLTFPVSWIAPPGFPHGELLSASGEGNSYSFDPDLILAWIDALPADENESTTE